MNAIKRLSAFFLGMLGFMMFAAGIALKSGEGKYLIFAGLIMFMLAVLRTLTLGYSE